MDLSDESNLFDLFLTRVQATPDGLAYRQYESDAWHEWTWAEISREVSRWKSALAHEKLSRGDRVALCLRNRTEWVLCDQAALANQLVTVPLYVDDRSENMAWCINDTGAKFLLIENATQWASLRHLVQTIQRVVCIEGTVPDDDRVRNLSSWLDSKASELARSPARPNDLATIIYTSGTSGRPRGVMLSHRNILSNVVASAHAIPAGPSDRFLSFLPLSHAFERTCGYYAAMLIGAQTVYTRSISLLAQDMRDQKPTILMAVPRIFERIWNRLQETMPSGSFKRHLFDKAVEVGWRRSRGKANVTDKLWWLLLKPLVTNKLHRSLGGRIRFIATGGAPFPESLARIFVGLGLPILTGYGLTETSPVLCTNCLNDNDVLSVGRPLKGIELCCDANSELLARGPNIMLGYWNNQQATAAVFDNNGWFRTGDLATIRDGRVYITGRLKDVIVMSNGKKVSPVNVEHAILRDNIFEQIMVIGEGRAKLSLLCITQVTDLDELYKRANAQLHEFPGHIRICYVTRIEGSWSVDNGLLTPTLKMKRTEIERRFVKEIEAMYATSGYC